MIDSIIDSNAFIAWVFVLGVCIGSFTMAVADRGHLPRGRSKCDNCQTTLDNLSLIPILGWTIRRGRCKSCNKSVSARYPLGELTFGLLVALSFVRLRDLVEGDLLALCVLSLLWLGLIATSWVMSTIDWRSMILPDRGNLVLFVISLLYWASSSYFGLFDWRQGFIGGLVVFAMFYGLFQLSGGKWIGGGDVKLAPSMGLTLGAWAAIAGIAAASYVALGYVLLRYFIARGKLNLRGLKLPFGPFLLFGTWMAFMFWDDVYNLLFSTVG